MDKTTLTPLGEIMTLHRGYDLPNSERADGEVPVYGSSGIAGWHDEYKIDGQNVITGRTGTIGDVFFCNGKCWPLNTTLYVSDFHGNDPLYVAYLLEYFFKIAKLDGGDKSTVPGVDRNALHPIPIPFESNYDDQLRIIAPLKALDDKIANNKNLIKELEDTARLIYDYWFTQFDFPDENGKPYRSSGGKMVWNDELKREIPEGWNVKQLKEIVSKIVTGKTPSTDDLDNYGEAIPFITIGDIRNNTFIVDTEQHLSEKGADSQSNKYIPENSICVTCIASPGLVGFTTQLSQTNQQINSVVCDNEESRYYLLFAIRQFFENSTGAKTGNTFANMSKGDFESILLICPPVMYLENFNRVTQSLFEYMKSLSEERKNLISFRNWLLPMLMNGQVSVGKKSA